MCSTRVRERRLGKCSSMFDAVASNNFNGGCGLMSLSLDCNDPASAFHNRCPSTGKTCTAQDPEVKGALCAPEGPKPIPQTPADVPCFWKGPAFDFPRMGGDELRAMVKERLKHQGCSDPVKGPCISFWNEVILDERVLLPALGANASSILTAFTYRRGDAYARRAAGAMRDNFCEKYKVAPIPVIAIDTGVDFTTTGGPFVAEAEEEHFATTIV